MKGIQLGGNLYVWKTFKMRFEPSLCFVRGWQKGDLNKSFRREGTEQELGDCFKSRVIFVKNVNQFCMQTASALHLSNPNHSNVLASPWADASFAFPAHGNARLLEMAGFFSSDPLDCVFSITPPLLEGSSCLIPV